MVQITKGETQYIYLTLTEKETISNPNYTFVCKNRSTNQEVKFILLNASDTSLFKERYNKFNIKTDKYFGGKPRGQYTYSVYQTSGTVIDETGVLLESGVLWLNDEKTIFTEYQTKDTYKIRQ